MHMASGLQEGEEPSLLPVFISALQHYSYCPRQCALIHQEQEFADNVHTNRGQAVHKIVDDPGTEKNKLVRIERALPLYSRLLGLVGKADIVEFHGTTPYPIEYKHGKKRTKLHDEIQLAAQALCLEEMTGIPVTKGALYYYSSRRRLEVEITAERKQQVKELVIHIRDMLFSGILPAPVNDNRCRECSLIDICQPSVLANASKVRLLLQTLFTPEEEL